MNNPPPITALSLTHLENNTPVSFDDEGRAKPCGDHPAFGFIQSCRERGDGTYVVEVYQTTPPSTSLTDVTLRQLGSSVGVNLHVTHGKTVVEEP